MARLTNDELVGICIREIERSDGYDGDEHAESAAKALDYYYRRPRGDEIAGRSGVISGDVADMVQALLAHMDSSLAQNAQAEFVPFSEEDEEQARVESAFCHDLIMNKSNGYVALLSGFKDALLLRNGILRVNVEETHDVNNQRFENIEDDELSAQMSLYEEAGNTVELVSRDDGERGAAVLKTTKTTRKFVVEAVPREHFLTQENYSSIFLDGARFVCERKLETRSNLRAQGVSRKLVEGLRPITSDTWTDSSARNRSSETFLIAQEKSQDMIEVFDCYLLVDADGDGISELMRIRVADRKLLDKEEVDFAPYAAGTGWLEPHRFTGMSVYDLLADIQDQKTAFLRQWVDNAMTNNNGRLIVVENQTRIGDAINSRSGGIIRVQAQGAVQPLPINDVGPSCLAALEYLDKVRTDRAGAAIDMVAAELQVSGNGGINGVERQISSREMIAASVTRTLAETMVRSLYLLVHATARSFLTGQQAFRSAGQWQETDPSTWPERKEVNIQVGMSAGERTKKVSSLRETVQMQMSMVQAGLSGVMVDNTTLHRALVDLGKASEIDVPENYFIDPASQQSQQAQQAQQQQQQAQQQSQAQVAQMGAQMQQLALRLEAEKVEASEREAAMKLEFDYWKEQLGAEIEEMKLVGGATLDLERVQLQGQLQSDAIEQGAANGAADDG